MKRTIIAGLIAVMALAGCQKHSDAGDASPSSTAAPSSASPSTPAFNITGVERRISAAIESANADSLFPQATTTTCPYGTQARQGATFDCSVSAEGRDGIDNYSGTANITLTDAAGATFSMHYRLETVGTSIEGTIPSVQ